MSEKRNFMRFGVLFDAMFRGSTTGAAKVNNFSKQGLGLITDGEVQQGEKLEIEMNIPGDNVPVICQGEIAWTKRLASEQNKNKCGVKIENMEGKDRGRVLEYIYSRWIMSSDNRAEGE